MTRDDAQTIDETKVQALEELFVATAQTMKANQSEAMSAAVNILTHVAAIIADWIEQTDGEGDEWRADAFVKHRTNMASIGHILTRLSELPDAASWRDHLTQEAAVSHQTAH